MFRNRSTRMAALLVLILAQAALAQPHGMMGPSGMAHAQAAGDMKDCHHGGAPHQQAPTPTPPCNSCPTSLPTPQGGGCLEMASCGAVSVPQRMTSFAAAGTVLVADLPQGTPVPLAHESTPEPPPPRA